MIDKIKQHFNKLIWPKIIGIVVLNFVGHLFYSLEEAEGWFSLLFVMILFELIEIKLRVKD